MKHTVHPHVAVPMDAYGLLGMQPMPFEFAEKAYRAWLDSAQSIQAEAAEFASARAGKDIAVLSEWARCTTPTDALEIQARYTSEAMSDYVAQSQRMVRLLTAAGQRGIEAEQ
jgi:Phasin protein